MKDMQRLKTRWENIACHQALLLALEMLTVLDLPTFMGSPQYEVPTRPHTMWCGSPIRYDGSVSIILKIFLTSCVLAQESGMLCLRIVRFARLMIASVTCFNGSFTVRGKGWRWVPRWMGSIPTQLGTHNTKDIHNFRWSSPLGCGSHDIKCKITHTALTD